MKRILVVLSALAVAGCLEAADPTEAGPASDGATVADALAAAVAGLECVDSNAALRPLATLPLEQGMHGEVDRHGDLLAVARYAAGGIELVDASDPLNPRLVGTFLGEPTGLDAKFSPDGTAVFVGNNDGIEIVDVRDPTEPVLIGTWSFPPSNPRHPVEQVHMMYAVAIAERDWLIITPTNTDGLWILEITGSPGDQSLRLAAKTGLPTHGAIIGPHDMWVDYDEVDKAWYLYSVDGFDGWSVWNLDDPESPQLITIVPPIDPYQGYTHTIQADWVDGRRIVVTVAEVGHNGLKVYDATELTAPILIATWQADPGVPVAPQHNIQFVGGYLFAAHYTYGVYVFDLSAPPTGPGLFGLEPIAQFLGTSAHPVGTVWDVVVADGIVWIGEHHTLYAVAFGCMPAGDAAWSSTG